MLKHIPFYASLMGETLFADKTAKAGHVLVYGAIEVHAMGELGCVASNKTIATETGLKETSVATIISTLAKAGWIKVELDKNNHRKGIDPLMVIKPPLTTINENHQNNRSELAPRDSIKNIKINKKEFDSKELLLKLISLVNPKEKAIDQRLRLLNARLKDYTAEEITNAAIQFSKSDWHKENKQMSIDNLLAPSKFGRWYQAAQDAGPQTLKERVAEQERKIMERMGPDAT